MIHLILPNGGICPQCQLPPGKTCGRPICPRHQRLLRLRRTVRVGGAVMLAAACLFLYIGRQQGRAAMRNAPIAPKPLSAEAQMMTAVKTHPRLPYCDHWQTFTTRDGLPSNEIKSIRVDGKRVWAGTDNGLACLENGKWKTWGVKDGLPHRVVLALDVDPTTGDLWLGTAGGAARFSGGRFEKFNQLNSGLANDLVYGLTCYRDNVWIATAAGVSRFNTRTHEWALFNQNNTIMFEPWCYAVSAKDDIVYVGVWGGGIVEYNLKTGFWRDYHDPDGEMEVTLIKDAGPTHEVVPAISYENGRVWAGSYFGLSTYDGRHWKNYFKTDSGLASDFINFTRAHGDIGWVCTDDGLSSFDGKTWVTYRTVGGRGEMRIQPQGGKRETRSLGPTLGHNYTFGIDMQGDSDVWVATAGGVSHGSARKI